MNLEDLYYHRMTTPGNIHEHLPTLRAFSCGVVVEIGTNEAVSTTALLAAQPAMAAGTLAWHRAWRCAFRHERRAWGGACIAAASLR